MAEMINMTDDHCIFREHIMKAVEIVQGKISDIGGGVAVRE